MLNETLYVTTKRDARLLASAMRVSVRRAVVAPRLTAFSRSATSPRSRRASSVAPRAFADPIMIVSDLDGTMVGDDAATAAFTAAWAEEGAFPPGSALVYSTGRSLDSFAALIAEKRDVMAVPDALICAVGTRVYKRVDAASAAPSLVESVLKKLFFASKPSSETANASPLAVDVKRELRCWIEDPDWTARLDADWDAGIVRAAAASAIAAAGAENAHLRPEEECSEHKITLGVRDAHVETVLAEIERYCGKNGGGDAGKRTVPKLIASGTGGWQYVDVVPRLAGKLESLEYVRRAFGVPTDRTVACGDSGNDILMLSGENKAIVVGNAQPALVRWAERASATERKIHRRERLFVAAEKEALGVLEGLRAFGLMAAKEGDP